jgi:CHASE3 domain sensor protein
MKKKIKKGSIRLRLVLVFAITTGVVFFTNMFMYVNINKSISTIDEVYVSNVGLSELLDSLNLLRIGI